MSYRQNVFFLLFLQSKCMLWVFKWDDMVTCWERADLLALICGVYCEFVTFPLVSLVRCGTWLYRFLIFAPLLTFLLSNHNICLIELLEEKTFEGPACLEVCLVWYAASMIICFFGNSNVTLLHFFKFLDVSGLWSPATWHDRYQPASISYKYSRVGHAGLVNVRKTGLYLLYAQVLSYGC